MSFATEMSVDLVRIPRAALAKAPTTPQSTDLPAQYLDHQRNVSEEAAKHGRIAQDGNSFYAVIMPEETGKVVDMALADYPPSGSFWAEKAQEPTGSVHGFPRKYSNEPYGLVRSILDYRGEGTAQLLSSKLDNRLKKERAEGKKELDGSYGYDFVRDYAKIVNANPKIFLNDMQSFLNSAPAAFQQPTRVLSEADGKVVFAYFRDSEEFRKYDQVVRERLQIQLNKYSESNNKDIDALYFASLIFLERKGIVPYTEKELENLVKEDQNLS